MNDKEKVEAIRKTLSLKIEGLMTYSRYVGLIHDIMDDKMTMTEVDDYIKDNFEPNSSKSDQLCAIASDRRNQRSLRKMTLTDEEKVKEALRHLDKLAEMIRYDQKRKRILFGNYQSRLETIKEILDGTREKVPL